MKRTSAVFLIILLVVILSSGVYSYITVSKGPIEPLGRLGFVKFANPDMYPEHPHSKLLSEYAESKESKCALVLHFAGSSNYRSYIQVEEDEPTSHFENNTYIIELAFIDTQGNGSTAPINWQDTLKVAIFGIPDGRYKFKSDGIVFNTYGEAMNHVYTLANEHGQKGPIPTVWHGSVRAGNPIMIQGCGFPLYFYVMTKEYGIIPAYVYTITGMIYPYFNDPYRDYELKNAKKLQELYTSGKLNYE